MWLLAGVLMLAASSRAADTTITTPTTTTTTTTPTTTTTTTTTTPTTTTTRRTTTEAPACPSGWVNAEDLGCFSFLEETNITWPEAMTACEKVGGYLAEIRTSSQLSLLSGLAGMEEEFYGIQNWWIGLSDLGHEGTWVWMHSYQEVKETFWSPGSPSEKPGNELDCGYAHLANGQLLWKDVVCGDSQVHGASIAPICQRGEFTSKDPTTTVSDTTTTTMAPTTTMNGPGFPGLTMISVQTFDCSGCAGSSGQEGGLAVTLNDDSGLTCTSGGLDNNDTLDYDNGNKAEFHANEEDGMGGCEYANLYFNVASGTATWTGTGTWTSATHNPLCFYFYSATADYYEIYNCCDLAENELSENVSTELTNCRMCISGKDCP